MPRRPLKDRNTRTLTKLAGGKSYAITLPIETLRAFGWETGTELTVKADTTHHRLIIERPTPQNPR
jgi:bifunctional DNA-binding transcriptional regulator/antitoxin component of YhaV-PrlF toxin-antitoxin module